MWEEIKAIYGDMMNSVEFLTPHGFNGSSHNRDGGAEAARSQDGRMGRDTRPALAHVKSGYPSSSLGTTPQTS